MIWSQNAQVFDLNNSNKWIDLDSFLNNQGSTMLITVTDESMYDRYLPNDTVQIKICQNPPDNRDCLILYQNEVSFRQLKNNPEDESSVFIIQTWPNESKQVNRKDLTILGYANGILRT